MQLSKRTKIFVGVATCWPPLYMLLFFAAFLTTITTIGQDPPAVASAIPTLLALHVLTMLEVLALLVFYVAHVFKNAALDQNARVLWAIFLFVGSFVAAAIYFVKFVWPEPHGPAARSMG